MPTTPDKPSVAETHNHPQPAARAPGGAPQRASRTRRPWGRVAWRGLMGLSMVLGAVVVLAAVAWAVLLLQILPRIDNWRVDLAEQASRALGVNVRIGHIKGQADGIWPSLTLTDVQLLDEQGRPGLRLPEVSARISLSTLSPSALVARELRLDRLVLVKPELDVRRDRLGVIHVAGLKWPQASPASASPDTQGADWALSQPHIEISQGTVRWTDELMDAQPLALQQLNLLLRNRPGLGLRRHDLSVEATPPLAFGQRFEVKAQLTQPFWQPVAPSASSSQPASWWQRVKAGATRPAQWQTWSGSVDVRLPQVDVQRLKQHVRLPIDIEGGRGALAAQLTLQGGTPSALSLDANVQGVHLRLAPNLQPLAFKQLNGRFKLTHAAELSTLSLDGLAFVLEDGVVWPRSSASVAWEHAPWPQLDAAQWRETLTRLTRGGRAQADRLDLALLARLVDRLPVNASLRDTLSRLAPQGVIEPLNWQWRGAIDAPVSYSLDGRARGLSWQAAEQPAVPGLRQADVKVSATEAGGRADVSVQQGSLTLPGVFDEPELPLGRLQARVDWRIDAPKLPAGPAAIRVDVTQAQFSNDDASGHLQARWETGEGALRFPGRLQLRGVLDQAQVARVWRYLPSQIPLAPRDYVRQALRSGVGEKVDFEVDGDLNAFPFKNDVGGRFRVKVPLRGVALDYVPAALMGSPVDPAAGAWPAFTSLDGLLQFEGQRMLIQGGRGQLGNVGSGRFALRNVEGRIDDLGDKDPHLTIKGQGEGPLNDLMRFLAVSPVGAWTGHVFDQVQSTGTGALQLSLDIPLDRANDTRVKGLVTLLDKDQASVRLNPNVPLFAALRGTVGFTESALNIQARTRVWGHEVQVTGQRGGDGITRVLAQGNMSAEGLRHADEYPVLAQLASAFTGETPFSVNVTVGKGDGHGAPQAEVSVNSSLQGMASALPAPLGKPAQAVWPLKVTHRLDDATGQRDALVVDLGNPQSLQMSTLAVPWLRVDFRRDTSGEQARVTRGAISLIQAAATGAAPTGVLPMPAKGVAAQVVVPALELDGWLAVARGFHAPDTVPRNNSSKDPAESYLPDSITVKTGALSYQQRTLNDVSGTLAHPAPGVWRAQIDARQVAGSLEWVPETAPLAQASANSRVVARLSRLSVPNADAQTLQEQAAEQILSTETARSIPALDIVVDQFEWRGLPLGRVEIEAVNRTLGVSGAAAVPEWRLTKFSITTPEAQLRASGNWAALGAQSASRRATGAPRSKPRSAFAFTLDLQNSGGLLSRLGLPQTVKGGKGQLTGQVSWLGSPMEPDPLTMAGDIKVLINEGQFLKVDPGVAKLLGVLSLQSLPRRLSLDFRDVFQEGFAFDAIDGDVKISQGVATTRNLRMRGVQAVVLMEGQADISRETQNLHVYVVPDVNAGGASLAYAAINPVIGLGTFLAQVLLRKQVADASTQEFTITGPWAAPQVEKVQGGKTAPSPDEPVKSQKPS